MRHSPKEMAKIETYIANLERSVELLTSDIEAEERRVRVFETSDPAYPCLARHLRSRRAKIRETIAVLRSRLGDAQRGFEAAAT